MTIQTRITAETLRALPEKERLRILQTLGPIKCQSLKWNWNFWARDDQLLPKNVGTKWLTLALCGGRGSGKTRTGAEWTRELIQNRGYGRIAIVAPTAADARDVMIEGESGIMATSPPWFRPKYEPSKRRLTWPNGAIAANVAKQLTLVNNSGTTISFRQDGAGVALDIPTGSSFTILGLDNANQISVRRTDTSNTQVTVGARWER